MGCRQSKASATSEAKLSESGGPDSRGPNTASQTKTSQGNGFKGSLADKEAHAVQAHLEGNAAIKSSPVADRGRSEPSVGSTQPQDGLHPNSTSTLKEFRTAEIVKATHKFSKRLGEGGFGVVYLGRVALQPGGDEVEVAVKVLRPDSQQGFKEFDREIRFLGELSHPNLVKLYGYACDTREWMVVYEYIKNRSVDYHLFTRVESYVLSFKHRMKIALGAARGLAYLHSRPGGAVIMRDFKTSNILVDKEFNAKLSDFGMAREGPGGTMTHISTGSVVGTGGYMAPEYLAHGQLSERCDVYGFGIVLLELVTGYIVSSSPDTELSLVEWVEEAVEKKRNVRELVDKKLQGDYVEKAVKICVKAALRCIELEPQDRPTMKNVVEVLQVAYAFAEGKQ